MINLPNSSLSLACYGWCRFYFSLVGDCEPNTNGELHLEPCKVVDIYKEYVTDQINSGLGRLGPDQFGQMWLKCFP
jgi:hypothetical protein